MPFANVERVPGGYVVSRFFAVQAAAQRGMDLLMSVNEAAFEPIKAYDAHPFDPVAAEEGDGCVRKYSVPCRWQPVTGNYEIKQFVTGSFGETLKGVIPGSARLDGQPLNLPSDADGS